jgi:CBS domain-containing protein
MRISEIMSDRVRTVPSTCPAPDAWQVMEANSVRNLVVKDGSEVVGILSESDAGGRNGASIRLGAIVADLMDTRFVTVTRHDTVRKAANLMRGRLVECLPVVEHGRLLGLVTADDLFGLLGRGVERPGHEARAALHHRVPHRKAPTNAGRW